MILKTKNNEYTTDKYGYGATMPDGTRTWSCSVENLSEKSAMDTATDLAGGNIEIYNNELLVEIITGFTRLRTFSCDVENGAIKTVNIILQEPGQKEAVLELQKRIYNQEDAMNELIMAIIPEMVNV